MLPRRQYRITPKAQQSAFESYGLLSQISGAKNKVCPLCFSVIFYLGFRILAYVKLLIRGSAESVLSVIRTESRFKLFRNIPCS